MTFQKNIGDLGENIAHDYLIKNKYKVIERNFRKPWGEIDIICSASDKTLVFVEVKTMHEGDLKPEDQLTKSKLLKIQKTAQLYTGHFPEKISEKRGWQIDLIAITFSFGKYFIKHYKNI